MKRCWKIAISILLTLALLILPVFAGGDQPNLPDEHEMEAVISERKERPDHGKIEEVTAENTENQSHTAVCTYCNIYAVIKTESYETSWFTVDYVNCKCEGGYQPMQDVIQENIVTTVYTCTACGISKTETVTNTRQKHYR